MYHELDRRKLLSLGLGSSVAFLSFLRSGVASGSGLSSLSKLNSADELGARLASGYKLRRVAVSGEKVRYANGKLSNYRWHGSPDGGACFSTSDGGWIYVSNSEIGDAKGGVGALRFGSNADLVDAYPILSKTSRNCAGGATPWNTWLSCEEISSGQVYECDPYGELPARPLPALGWFNHEAAAVDLKAGYVYLTEDDPQGCLYRFKAINKTKTRLELDEGILEVACMDQSNKIFWKQVPNVNPKVSQKPTRFQLDQAIHFNGGEGIFFHDGLIFFTTKGDNRVWSYDTKSSFLDVVYDASSYTSPILTGVDNITVSSSGKLLVAEDGGDMQIVVLDTKGNIKPLLQLTNQAFSEITGPAISPNKKYLYFSSQRGPTKTSSGITYELVGDFT